MSKKLIHSLLIIGGLFLSIICSPLLSLGQRFAFKPQVHQLELQLGSIHSTPAYSDFYESEMPIAANYLNGGRYTYHYSLTHGFRVGVFRRTTSFFKMDYDQYSEYRGEKRDLDFTLGYIYKYHINAVQLFAGLDLRYSNGKLDERESIIAFGEPVTSYQTYGAGGFAGIRFFLSQGLSFALEGNATYSSLSDPYISTDISGIGALPYRDNLLDLSAAATLSFHFVNMKKRCTCPRFK